MISSGALWPDGLGIGKRKTVCGFAAFEATNVPVLFAFENLCSLISLSKRKRDAGGGVLAMLANLGQCIFKDADGLAFRWPKYDAFLKQFEWAV